mmetsp:Transcript_24750/g.58442  ORF Transcript_24750/g.58442 Transcript_24750/m.58442 type:complete len:214 (-) Transcript_24750:687-1328(-)
MLPHFRRRRWVRGAWILWQFCMPCCSMCLTKALDLQVNFLQTGPWKGILLQDCQSPPMGASSTHIFTFSWCLKTALACLIWQRARCMTARLAQRCSCASQRARRARLWRRQVRYLFSRVAITRRRRWLAASHLARWSHDMAAQRAPQLPTDGGLGIGTTQDIVLTFGALQGNKGQGRLEGWNAFFLKALRTKWFWLRAHLLASCWLRAMQRLT